MNALSNLLERTKALLSRPPAGSAQDAIAAGTLDGLIYHDLLEEAPALRDLVDSLHRKHSFTEDLVRDVLLGFYQGSPRLRTKPEMRPDRLTNHTVMQAMMEAPDTASTRTFTVHNKYGATMATIGVAGKLRTLLAQTSEAQDAVEEAQASEQQLQEAQAALQEAQDALENALGQEEVTEPSEQAQALAEALEQAAQAMEGAAQVAAETQAEADKQLQRARGRLVAPVAEAVRQAGEDLAAEEEILFAWGSSPGEAKMMSFDERQQQMAMLSKSEVTAYADLLGRFKFAEKGHRAKRISPGHDEVYAIERSDRLADVLSGELTLLADPDTEMDFLVRYSEGQLLTKSYRGVEKAARGPMIVCVDTSDSMNRRKGAGPSPAVWSKCFALALLERARADKRDFIGILFSSESEVDVHEFPKGEGTLAQTVAFVSKAFNGGTNFEAPLNLALELAARHPTAKGGMDTVFITDDDYHRGLPPQWLQSFSNQKKQLGMRVWGLAVARPTVGSSLEAVSDNVRTIQDFTSPDPVGDLLQAV